VPTYDYVCTSCGHEIEVMHSVHGHGPAACPVCGAPMKKAMYVPAVHFKGTGWARKERASGKPAKAAPQEPGSSGASDARSGSGEPSREPSGESSGEPAPTASDSPKAAD
jgi:putative FmdB family regulatory protein